MAATAQLGGRPSAHESSWLWWAYLFGGASYPLWWLLGPRGANDPWWAWWLIGAIYAAAGAVALRMPRMSRLCFAPSFATAIHLHILFALHPSVPFYALAPALNVFSSLLVFQDARTMIAFTAMVLVLSLLPLVFGNGADDVLFYASGAASLLFLANRRLVRERTSRSDDTRLRNALREVNLRYEQERSDRLRLQQELEMAQRMESLGQLAGHFAHEFNNHLMAIHLYSEMMGQALPPDSPLHKDLRNMSEATSEAAALSARLLAYSSSPPRQEDRIDLTQAVRASRVTIEHLMAHDTQVLLRLPEESCPVAIAPERVEQLLLNLALNARDAMPSGGVFQVALARRRAGDVALPDGLAHADVAELVVSDTGVGIAPEDQPHVFQPFFTTKDETTHSGLGLSVVYGIVSDAGGVVRLKSAKNQGARFEIYWPLCQPSRARRAPALRASTPPVSPRHARA